MRRDRYSHTATAALIAAVVVLLSSPAVGVETYVEDFTTTTYLDTLASDALWDTSEGEISLHPFEIAQVGTTATTGNAQNVTRHGDYLFVCESGDGIEVIDISDVTAPAVVGSYDTPGYSYEAVVAGDILYVADDTNGLLALDISDPESPSFVSQYTTSGKLRGIAVAGDLAYLADRDGGFVVLDVSDPTSPALVGSVGTPGLALGVELDGDVAYVSNWENGVQVIDISDPTTPSIVGSCDTPDRAWFIDLDGDHLYVGDSGSGLQVVDVSDPTDPAIVGSYDTPGNAQAPTVAGDYVYMCDWGAGFHVLDVTDPTSPELLQSYDTPGYAIHLELAGVHAFVADRSGGVRVLEVCDTMVPEIAASVDLPSSGRGIVVDGDRAYLLLAEGSVEVFDMSAPRSPASIGSVDLANAYDNCWGIALSGDILYAGQGRTLNMLDVSTPSSPVLVDTLWTVWSDDPIDYSSISDLQVYGDHLYAGLHSSSIAGLEVLDISDPTAPSSLGYTGDILDTYFVRVSGELLYNATGAEFNIVDVSDPTTPGVLGTHTGLSCSALAVDGDVAYTSDGCSLQSYVHALDVSDPSMPSPLSVYNLGFGASPYGVPFMVADGDVLFVLTSYSQAVDVSDPAAPVLIAEETSPGGSRWMGEVAGDYIICASGSAYANLQVLQIYWRKSDPSRTLVQSLDIEGAGEVVKRARMETEQTGTIDWSMSADGGANWVTVPPSVGWVSFGDDYGSELLWKAEFVYDGDVEPSCQSLTIEYDDVTSGIEDAPRSFALHQNSPNPFNPVTTIRYDVPATGGDISLVVYDVAGRTVRTLVDGPQVPGERTATWDGTDENGARVASGVYYCRMVAPGYERTAKLTLLK